MTFIPPVVGPINTDLLGGGFFRQYSEIAPFTYRAGMTFASELEALRVWTFRTLVPFLNDEFGDMQDSWVENVLRLTSTINDGLKQQSADNAQKIADALTAIAEADIPITDPGVLAVLNSPTTGTRGWLDAHYQPKGDYQPAGNYQPAGSYLTPTTNAQNAITGWWHVDDFGAKGDGTTKDQGAIQAAIDAASAKYTATGVPQRVFFQAKVYLIGAPSGMQNPVVGITLKSGVEIFGQGTLKTAPGTIWNGTDWAILRSPVEGITDCGIRDLTFDGNRDAFTGVPGAPDSTKSCNNITLRTVTNCRIVNVKSRNSVATGIMVAGSSSNLSKTVVIEDCNVWNCNVIGIQVSQFDGLEIINNHISWTGDNAIDIYGEPISHSGGSTGTNFSIRGNKIHDCGNGIFPETVAAGVIQNNNLRNLGDAGIHVNRINAEPNRLLIENNYVYGCQSGVIVTGDTGGVTIRNNLFEYYNKAGVTLGGNNNTNVSQVYIIGNTMNGNSLTIPMVLCPAANQLANIIISGNITKNRDRTFDFVNYCTNNVGISKKASISPGDVLA